MISRKTLLRDVAGVFVSAKELNERVFLSFLNFLFGFINPVDKTK